MKPARLIVLGVALAAGAVAAMLAAGGRQPEAPKAPPPPALATLDVLVAKADLGIGQVVGDGDVGWQTWPAASATASFIRKGDRPDAIKDFVGAIVRSPVSAGEPIRDSKAVSYTHLSRRRRSWCIRRPSGWQLSATNLGFGPYPRASEPVRFAAQNSRRNAELTRFGYALLTMP